VVGGRCFTEEDKITLVFKDGNRYMVGNDGKANCDGIYKLMFLGNYGKETILEAMQKSELYALRINSATSKGFVEETFEQDASLRFKGAVNCILNIPPKK
jgi:hypothetical protein